MLRSRQHYQSRFLRKRRDVLLRRLSIFSILGLLTLSLGILGLTHHSVRIYDVQIQGNATVLSADIAKVAEGVLATRYLGFIPTDNALLLKRFTMKDRITDALKKVDTVSVSLSGFTGLSIQVAERAPETLWCDDACYFMDADGFVFAEAPNISGNPYMIYEGVLETDPIGQTYLKEQFSQVKQFMQEMRSLGFMPTRFFADGNGEYIVSLLQGGEIKLNDTKTFAQNFTHMRALVDEGYIKVEEGFLSRLAYIDLRFGNKPFFKMR